MKEVTCKHWAKEDGVHYVCRVCGRSWEKEDTAPVVVIGEFNDSR